MAEIDLTGKVAIVTGASRGIGRAIALGLARAGAAVVGTARQLDASPGVGGTLAETVALIEAAGGSALAVPADITDPAGAQALAERARAELGRIDVLVNNAGVYPRGAIVDFPPEEWLALMAVNVNAPFFMCRAVLPTMIAQGGGNILNVSSNSARHYSRGRAGYSTSKAALERFSMSLAEEVREHGIAVNAWTPGLVATDMNSMSERGVQPEAVAESAVWLAAQDASFTGHVVAREEFGVSWGVS